MPCCAAVEDTSCTSDANCTTIINSECNTSINRCRCLADYYVDGSNCQSKGNNGGDCTSGIANSCLYPGHLVCNSGNKCSCSYTATHYWHATSMTCKTRGDNGGDCTSGVANSCLYSGQLVCNSNNKCSCADPNTHYWDTASMTCKPRGDNGGDCTDGIADSCLYPGQLVCTDDNKCSCSDTNIHYWHATSMTCKIKKPLGGDCTAAIECLVANSECALKCQCKEDYYDTNNADSGGNCEPLKNLKVSTIELKTRSETYLLIQWTPSPAVNAIEEYRFLVGGTSTEVSVGKQLEANVTGLIPGDLYTITVISVDSNSRPDVQTTSPAPVNQATLPAVPGPIDLVNSDLTASDGQIIIRWKSTGTFMSYTVTISELVPNSTVVNDPSYVIGNNAALRNGHKYTLTVKSHSNSLESAEYTEEFPTVTTQPNPPTVPSSCNTDDLKSTSIYVRWQAPVFPNGDILYYLVDTVSGPTTVPQFNTSTNVLVQKVEPLQEEMTYCFKVRTVNDGPEAIHYSIYSTNMQCCQTRAGLSTVPTSVMHSTTSRSIDISWSKPDNSKGAITGYRLRVLSNNVCVAEVLLVCNPGCINVQISYTDKCLAANKKIIENRNSTELMSSMSYVVDQLLPYTDYDVWINAINAAGDGDRNKASVQTDSEAPTNVKTNVLSSRNISVSWNYPANPKGDIFGYRLRLRVNNICKVEIIFYCTDCPNAQNIPYKDCVADKQRQTITLNKNQINTTISYVVEQLLPYTKYDVWIAAHNAANDGMRHESEVETISEVPQKPLSVVASVVSSSEIVVTWNQPTPRPGITKYYIKAYEVILNALPVYVELSNTTGFCPQNTTFSGLEAYWNYTFSVVAATDKGNSEQSEMAIMVTTHQDAPGKVTSFLIRRPTNILTTMEVSWAIPSLPDRNGIIKEYTISHNVSGTTTVETIAADSEVFQKLYSITPDRHYQVEIYAVNSINQVGEKERKIYYASSKIERETDADFSIGTVVGAAVGCLVLGVLVTVILFCLIMKRRRKETSKESSRIKTCARRSTTWRPIRRPRHGQHIILPRTWSKRESKCL